MKKKSIGERQLNVDYNCMHYMLLINTSNEWKTADCSSFINEMNKMYICYEFMRQDENKSSK